MRNISTILVVAMLGVIFVGCTKSNNNKDASGITGNAELGKTIVSSTSTFAPTRIQGTVTNKVTDEIIAAVDVEIPMKLKMFSCPAQQAQ